MTTPIAGPRGRGERADGAGDRGTGGMPRTLVYGWRMDHLKPREAHAFLASNPDAVWIDCRTEAEHFLVGHPVVERDGADPLRPHNVWWADDLKGEMNERFVDDVAAVAPDRATPVVLICRSGRRSVSAGEALEAAGWTAVRNVIDGFEGPLDERFRRGTQAGWRFEGLPWEQL
ncbi:MAG: hypothetical protein RJA99_4192 [Pseudomonadota bacterium]|jgi:rhodanese-related sulfurtransferase